ncbi:putative bifunctional diguanylate cyclase/phosphodiesterase [Anoxybacteroides amylolyticum]|uniref:Diguanylate cyclase domain protein n=1 Tax=Anoxybacteroides amylolyticum TaxID=294699 RepID=A0A160F7E5_9BACL|nr:EAL domain-containing protein [Anoxybacillus amylolyticus]ANB62035.1 diguanylate cyclase domain protein [Anoxybacillus amylolyticus]
MGKWRCAIFISVYIAAYYGTIFFVDDATMEVWVSSFFSIFGSAVSLSWLLTAYFRMQKTERRFWGILSLSIFSYLIAEIVYRYDELLKHMEPPFPSWSDVFYMANTVLYCAALIHIILRERKPFDIQKALLDALIVITVCATFSWIYLIQPLITPHMSFLYLFVLISYPLLDLVVAFLLLVLLFSVYSSARTILWLNLFGISLFVVADTIYLVQMLRFDYVPHTWLDPLWIASVLITGLSGVYASEATLPFSYGNERSVSRVKTFFPYISLFPLFCLFFFYESRRGAAEIGFMMAIVLVVVRQVVTLLENERLVRNLQWLNSELEQKVTERTKELQQKNDELFYAANHDFLTGLPNRRSFVRTLEQAIIHANQQSHLLAVIFIDVDRFKQINDYFGHRVGDELLVKISERLKQSLRSADVIARQGGDEFIALIAPIQDLAELRLIVPQLLDIANDPIAVAHTDIRISLSVGVAVYPYDGETAEMLMKNADIAMYRAKEQGKNQAQFFDGKMEQTVCQKTMIETALYQAIEKRELKLFYQPQFDLVTGDMIGMEALIRWVHPEMGIVSPGVFIPVAEETGQIIVLGEWVIEEACRQIKQWNEQSGRSLQMSINISPKQFLQENLVNYITSVLKETNLPAELLDLEITEGVAVFNEKYTIEKLKRLKQIGVHISIDDFGTGYSSLSYLRKFPIDRLKIAKPFIDGITEVEEDAAIVASIIVLGKSLKLRVIAEGVETNEQLRILRSLRCDEIQGYVLGKPLPKEEFEKVYLF